MAGIDGGTVGYVQTANTYTTTKHYLADLHGDIKTASTPTPTGGTPDGNTYDTDEYGNPYTNTRRYTWLGDHQRSTDSLAGTILMGVRLYTPTLGRFLTTDPVYGGNDNTYTYPLDPINQLDLNGHLGLPKWAKKTGTAVKKSASTAWKATGAGSRWLTESKWGKRIHTACGFAWGQ